MRLIQLAMRTVSSWISLVRRSIKGPWLAYKEARVGVKAAVIGSVGAIVAAIIISPVGDELAKELFHRSRATITARAAVSGAGYSTNAKFVSFSDSPRICAPGDTETNSISKLFIEFNLFDLERDIYVESAEIKIPWRADGTPWTLGELALRSLDYVEYSQEVFEEYPVDSGIYNRGSAVDLSYTRAPRGQSGTISFKHLSIAQFVEGRAGSSVQFCLFFRPNSQSENSRSDTYCIDRLPRLRIKYLRRN